MLDITEYAIDFNELIIRFRTDANMFTAPYHIYLCLQILDTRNHLLRMYDKF